MNQHTASASNFNQHFSDQGFLVLEESALPLLPEDWRRLSLTASRMDYVKIVGGDTGDAHSVSVGRYINDVIRPEILHPLANEVLGILHKSGMQHFVEKIIGKSPLCLRRLQANKLGQQDFIGYHIDQDTTPDYLATAILIINQDYKGGEFVIHHPTKGDITIKPSARSMIINRGDIPHQVLAVVAGERVSLACFYSENFGETIKPRARFVIESQPADSMT